MKKVLLAIIITCCSFCLITSAQEVISPYVAVSGGYVNWSESVFSSYYPVLGVMAEHGAGQKMLISTGYGSGFLDMFTKISPWSRLPTVGNIDSANFIAIGLSGNSYTPGNFMIDGSVGIGTITPREKLSVNGTIRAREIKIESAANWPDYVFKKGYQLTPLSEIEKYINSNSHLPEIPSAVDVRKEGIALGKLNNTLLKKIEELTLHLIKQNKSIITQNKKLLKQEKQINLLQSEINAIKKKNKSKD